MSNSTIGGINLLPEDQKRAIYTRLIPCELLERFHIPANLCDSQGRPLFQSKWAAGNPSAEMALFHEYGFPDPLLFGHLTDTLAGQIHVLLYILNDPTSARYDVDKMPDGRPTQFGTLLRNLEAEEAAMLAGLAPGQIRHGLRLLATATTSFESFVHSLGHDLYFVEPLYYHNAVIFERYGFAYQQGRRLMDRIHAGFSDGGDLLGRLDGSPFRTQEAWKSIRLRSWAIHDGLLGQPFKDVTMYKFLGKSAGINTAPGTDW